MTLRTWIVLVACTGGGCASVETQARPGPLQDAAPPVEARPKEARPIVSLVLDDVVARAKAARDERGWQAFLADQLNRSERFIAHTRDVAVARRRHRLEDLGLLMPQPRLAEGEPTHQVVCSVLQYEHDVRPLGGFMLGPIRSNDHLVTAKVSLAYRVVDAATGRELHAGQVRETGETTSKVTQLNIGSYDPQTCDPAPAFHAAEARVVARLLAELAIALP